MHFSKILLTLVAILLAVGIYFLPKVVVDNEQKSIGAEDSDTDGSTPALDTLHTIEIPEAESNRIEGLSENLKSSTNNKKSAIFADSLAQLYAALDLLDSAAYYGDKAAKLYPELSRWITAGDYYREAYSFAIDLRKQEELKLKAREYYQLALEQQPDELDVKANLALTYLPGEVMKGVTMLREVAEADPNNQLAQYNLGLLSLQSQQYGKARDRFEQLIKTNPDHLEGQFYLGIAFFELDMKQEARTQFNKVKKLGQSPEVEALADEYLEKLE